MFLLVVVRLLLLLFLLRRIGDSKRAVGFIVCNHYIVQRYGMAAIEQHRQPRAGVCGGTRLWGGHFAREDNIEQRLKGRLCHVLHVVYVVSRDIQRFNPTPKAVLLVIAPIFLTDNGGNLNRADSIFQIPQRKVSQLLYKSLVLIEQR